MHVHASDLRNAATAEEAYFASNEAYLTHHMYIRCGLFSGYSWIQTIGWRNRCDDCCNWFVHRYIDSPKWFRAHGTLGTVLTVVITDVLNAVDV